MPWLGFQWARCRCCSSVQKILDKTQFEAINPTYDPGFLQTDEPDPADLQRAIGVDRKSELLRTLLGPDLRGRLLDIGCGMGGYLLAARRLGLEVVGVEPSTAHSRAAVEVFGLDVRQGYFHSADFEEPFDYAILSHVIEHIYLPGQLLEDVYRIIKPGGCIVVITPNCGSFSAKVTGKYWSMYKPVDHVTMLTKRSLKHAIPVGATLRRAYTSEWPGEFAAHCISAIKTAVRPRIGNVGGDGVKGSVRIESLGNSTKAVLALISIPAFLIGRLFDSQSCLYALIQKERELSSANL